MHEITITFGDFTDFSDPEKSMHAPIKDHSQHSIKWLSVCHEVFVACHSNSNSKAYQYEERGPLAEVNARSSLKHKDSFGNLKTFQKYFSQKF